MTAIIPGEQQSPLQGEADLMTSGEVARAFRVDPATVTRWENEGKLTAALRTLGGHRRFRASDVRSLLITPEHDSGPGASDAGAVVPTPTSDGGGK